ncbi:hypothetical protein FOA52_007056 [Chlamydomonas sp. UWO 241]|nr:hypothetical protein FOA52_007056 [Chlamydomonas sp. UWO 241]
MCFSEEVSWGFAALALGAAAVLKLRGRPVVRSALLIYFGLMEVFQALTYRVIEDECSGSPPNKWNQVLTLVSYIHVSCQPLAVNWFIFGVQKRLTRNNPKLGHDQVASAVARLCMAFAVLMFIKALPAVLNLADDVLPWPLRVCGADAEFLCDPGVQGWGCSAKGHFHLQWRLRLIEEGYYIPGLSMHFFLFFMPALLLCEWPLKIFWMIVLVTGPLLLDRMVLNNRAAHLFEEPAIWCQFSVAQALLALVWELVYVPIVTRRKRAVRAAGLLAAKPAGDAQAVIECVGGKHKAQ